MSPKYVGPNYRRTRSAKRKRRAATSFGYELGMLAKGAPLIEVLRSAFGSDESGRVWVQLWCDLLWAVPSQHKRRAIVRHFLNSWQGARRHGAQWRLVDELAYVGKRTELVTVHEHDPRTGEVTSTKQKRRHVPKGETGGLAVREDRTPRTLDEYRRVMRIGGVWRSAQPDRDAEDAVLPDHADARWAYAQHWLALPPSAEMLRRFEFYEPPPRKRPSRRSFRRTRAMHARPVLHIDAADVPY